MNNAKLHSVPKALDLSGLTARLDELLDGQRKLLDLVGRQQQPADVERDQVEQPEQQQPDQVEAAQQRIRDSRSRPKPNQSKEAP